MPCTRYWTTRFCTSRSVTVSRTKGYGTPPPHVVFLSTVGTGDFAQNQVMLGPIQRRTWRKNGWLAACPPSGRADFPHRSTFLGEVSRRQGRVASTYSRTCDRSRYGVGSGNVPGPTDLPAA